MLLFPGWLPLARGSDVMVAGKYYMYTWRRFVFIWQIRMFLFHSHPGLGRCASEWSIRKII